MVAQKEEAKPKEAPTPAPAAPADKVEEDDADKGKMIQVEEKQSGLIPLHIYVYWARNGNGLLFLLVLVLFCLITALRVGGSWWLTQWVTDLDQTAAYQAMVAGNMTTNTTVPFTPKHDLQFWVWSYFGWLIGECVTLAVTVFLGIAVHAVNASRGLHEKLLLVLTYAITAFYDRTPLGRILARLSVDVGLIDTFLPVLLQAVLNSFFGILAAIISLAFGVWYTLPMLVPLLIVFLFFQRYYRTTNIEIQRLESLSGAPPISSMSMTLEGLVSIRAYKVEDQFRNKLYTSIDYNNMEKHCLRYGYAWFGISLEYIAGSFVCIVFFAISLARNYYNIDANFAGVALSFLAGVVSQFSFAFLLFTDVEIRMNCVERLWEFNKIETENPHGDANYTPDPNWPSAGQIEFNDFSFKYRKGPIVLRNLNFTIPPKCKVGIVGRTGSGKSSLLQALFRMEEPHGGCVLIDGVDTTSVSLSDLRRSLAIIPQDPVMFLGTLRYNLDPFDEKTDQQLWDSLEMVQLKDYIKGLEGGLESAVAEDGKNFSVGQRQLICMSRALLRNSPILLLDEATASVDVETDTLIQTTVRRAFKDKTVLTIAHRINTIIDSDRVLVLDRGVVREFDSPTNLVNNPKSIFASMVKAAGMKAADVKNASEMFTKKKT